MLQVAAVVVSKVKYELSISNFNIYSSTTTGQTPSAEEDHAIRSKAPEQLLNNYCFQGQE